MAAVTVPLVCLPFAGGGASFYRAWQKLNVPGVRPVPLQLPGREERFLEEPYTDVFAAAAHLAAGAAAIAAEQGPIALYGHSLGAVLAFETAREVEARAPGTVRHLFVSGSPGPWTGRTRHATGLDDADFLAQVAEFAGYRHEALEDPDAVELLLPLLRVDVAMHESYRARSDDRLPVPITSIRGSGDTLVSAAQAAEWRAATSADFVPVELPGGHMYLVDAADEVLRMIAGRLVGGGGDSA